MKAIKFVKWLLTLAGIGFVIYLILAGYQYYFTGFNSYQIQKASGSETIPPKFLWDWFGLLVIPVALAIVVFLLNRSEEVVKREVAKFEKEADRKIAEHNAQADREQNIDRQREESLQNYFDKMTELLLQYNLKANHDEVVANIARVKTLATVRVLDGMRKGLVLKFLFDAGLILGDKPIIDLQFADFSKTDYPNAYIGNANLTRVDFQDAKLRGLEMNGAIVRGTNFENADLVDVKLHECSFEGTIFHNTQLNGTSIFQSSFINIKFRKCLLVNTIWENCIFQNTHFISADLFNSKMKKVVFQSQRFDDTNFSKSSFEDVNFNGSIVFFKRK